MLAGATKGDATGVPRVWISRARAAATIATTSSRRPSGARCGGSCDVTCAGMRAPLQQSLVTFTHLHLRARQNCRSEDPQACGKAVQSPVRCGRVPLWLVRAMLTIAAGGLAVAHQAQTHILAVHTCVCAPLIVAAFMSSVAERERRTCEEQPRYRIAGRSPPVADRATLAAEVSLDIGIERPATRARSERVSQPREPRRGESLRVGRRSAPEMARSGPAPAALHQNRERGPGRARSP